MAEGIQQCDAGFSFIDFLPEIDEPGKFFKSATFVNFRTLVDRANEFLRSNRKWKIVTCESIELKTKRDKIDPNKMTYLEYGRGVTAYIRGLRLWLTERKDESEREQQIGYINLIPERLEKGGIFKAAKFETLDTVIGRFNSTLKFNPLPGRVITIESQKMKVLKMKKFDPDRSNWYEAGGVYITNYVFVIRIFYEVMDGIFEEIGVQDFIPDVIIEGGCISPPNYEKFSNVVNKASAWCASQQDLRFCNAQTLELHCRRKLDEVDSQKMDGSESSNITRFYVRILRVAYTKPIGNPSSVSDNLLPIRELTCRIFQPLQVTSGKYVPDYEDLVATKRRVSAWVKATGARVLSAETTVYRMKAGGEDKEGSEATFTWSIKERSEYWMFGIRLYLNGVYQEPPPEMLPPPPEVLYESKCCQVS